MDYEKIYKSLIEKRINNPPEGYSERHHIIPKCLGGSNKKENIVRLTAEEHFVAHQLLVKIYPSEKGLVFALRRLSSSGLLSNKEYGWIKKRHSEAMRDSKLSRSKEEIEITNAKMKETRSKWSHEYKEELYKRITLTRGHKPRQKSTESLESANTLTRSEKSRLQRAEESESAKKDRLSKHKKTISERTEEQRKNIARKRAKTFSKKTSEEIAETNRKRNETHRLRRLKLKSDTTDDGTP